MKVFVSHSHADAELAPQVSKALRNVGLEVWDPVSISFPPPTTGRPTWRALEKSGAPCIRLQPALRSTDDQLNRFCRFNGELRIERGTEGDVTILPLAGSVRSVKVSMQAAGFEKRAFSKVTANRSRLARPEW